MAKKSGDVPVKSRAVLAARDGTQIESGETGTMIGPGVEADTVIVRFRGNLVVYCQRSQVARIKPKKK